MQHAAAQANVTDESLVRMLGGRERVLEIVALARIEIVFLSVPTLA